MDDKELADKVVALGVARVWKEGVTPGGYKLEGRGGSFWLDPHTFVRDWRVTGALMEKCAKQKRTIALSFGAGMFCATDAESSTPTYGVYLERSNESAPRAINEACVSALTTGDSK